MICHARSHVPATARALLSSFDERADHYEAIDRRSQGRSLISAKPDLGQA
jgi:hypothetical protein